MSTIELTLPEQAGCYISLVYWSMILKAGPVPLLRFRWHLASRLPPPLLDVLRLTLILSDWPAEVLRCPEASFTTLILGLFAVVNWDSFVV